MEKGENAATKPADPENDSCRICKYFLTSSMELENRSIPIPVSAAPADGTAVLIHPRLGQVSLFTSSQAPYQICYHVGTIQRTPKNVTYTLINGTRKRLLNRNAFLSGYSVI